MMMERIATPGAKLPTPRVAAIALLLVMVAAGCGPDEGDVVDPGARVVFSGTEATLIVRIADSAEEQRQGLMGVESLGEDHGMAFVYDDPTAGSFWMKGTLIPLSIAFVDGDRIVAIEEMTPCETDPCPTWDSGGAAYTLAIEANAGWFTAHGIAVGDRATLERIGYV
jgi:uncharacterized membrane protein (UPF0127 family)